ncbi:MAG: hypothetical protein JSV77_01695 [Dehalococcoidales bacterium]|nr:MAG: hypothetical protein JSV77_01695 [Dehalococcoidales bacterium]
MGKTIDPRTIALETNSPLWQISDLENGPVLQVLGNTPTTKKTGTEAYLDEDHVGKVALIGETRHNYRMQAEMRFLKYHRSPQNGGWFGFAIRAQDVLNYEIVWFMPNAETGNTVAYVPVAHGVVPWWTEAYASQKKGDPHIPINSWFQACVDVVDDEFTVYVENQPVFTKKITYYLKEGCPGFFVGTATDAAFRRIVIEDL